MSEESVNSSRRPIITLEDYKARNAKRSKDYYYRNQDVLKVKMKERAQSKRDEIKNSVKTVLEVVGEISAALQKIQDLFRTLESSQRVSTSPDLSHA